MIQVSDNHYCLNPQSDRCSRKAKRASTSASNQVCLGSYLEVLVIYFYRFFFFFNIKKCIYLLLEVGKVTQVSLLYISLRIFYCNLKTGNWVGSETIWPFFWGVRLSICYWLSSFNSSVKFQKCLWILP